MDAKTHTAMKLIIIFLFDNIKYIFMVSLRHSGFVKLMETNEVSFIV